MRPARKPLRNFPGAAAQTLPDVEEWPAPLRASMPTLLPTTISLSWYPERAKGLDAAIPPPRLTAGERWRFTVRLKRPRGLANPHTFDFEPFAPSAIFKRPR